MGQDPSQKGDQLRHRAELRDRTGGDVFDPSGQASGCGRRFELDYEGALTPKAFAVLGFNPTVDRVRVVTSTGLNVRVNPITGAPVDGDLAAAAGSVSGINPDGTLNGATSAAAGVSYTDALGGATSTTLYALDAVSNALYIQTPPNAGTTTHALPVMFIGGPLDFTAPLGFAVARSVHAPAANTPVVDGSALAALTVAGSTHLSIIDLRTGAATDLGAIGGGAQPLAGLAIGQTTVR